MKKALAGPAKRTAKKKPERRAMIAAARRRIGKAPKRGLVWLRSAPKQAVKWTRKADRRTNRVLERSWPPISRTARRIQMRGRRWGRAAGKRLRPAGVLALRLMALVERVLLRAGGMAKRAATAASGVLTPERAICLTILAAAICLVVSQFVDYRAVEVGQPGYAGLTAAAPPAVDPQTAGQAHAYVLVLVGALAGAMALAVMRNGRRRGLGRIVFALGLLSLAVILLIDLPAGLDAGAQTSRFSGAKAVLYDGFYAQIAAAAGLMLGGALLVLAPKAAARYHARPCRTRTNSFARAASALRRRRPRRGSSRGKGARRGSRRRSGAVSAPASPR
jgi:hypothetical protein